ncbi:helix-turn-helix domain-containing protein [Nocardia sp. NRRL S-836]|uniref:winged helix-turn-helix transcriptional regulator n=1 Tax=Nocardia sp. NRRL S-836 TaxID=1519492 RepID=UPI0006AE9429|nr:helix-turn-helix domain-containing protein [Nocardia sp. NRRL S-836]KOV80773.1 HxlR family transcriptional regulator [Nocardia sp. NRRL S-836]
MSYASFASLPCTLGRPAALLGERWTLLLLRQIFLGTRRFEDFQSAMEISRSVLTDRLSMLLDEGVLKRVPYQADGRTRHEYRLTEKGRDLYPVLMALRTWGEKWMLAEQEDEPFSLEHRDCGGGVRAKVECTGCGAELTARDVHVTARS